MLISYCVQEFLEDRRYRNLSEKTIQSYQIILKLFQDYCSDKNLIDIAEITPSVIKSFLMHLQNNRGNNPVSRNSKLRTLKTWFNYLVETEIVESKQNPCKRIQFAREETNVEPFTDQQIHQMLGYLKRRKQRNKSFVPVRDYMIVVFLLGTGVRLGELVNLKWSDVDLINGSASIIGKKRELSSVPLTQKLIQELAEYKIFCEKKFNKLDYVFPTRNNTKLLPDSAKCIFKRMRKALNFPNRLSFHSFRHTFAVMSIRNGMDAFTLQRLLRHSELTMTNRYINMFGTALKDQASKFSPLNDIEL